MATKKLPSPVTDDLRPEYDLGSLRGGVRGKYFRKAIAAGNIVLLDPDVARAFPDDRAVNEALRALLAVASRQVAPPSRKNRSRGA